MTKLRFSKLTGLSALVSAMLLSCSSHDFNNAEAQVYQSGAVKYTGNGDIKIWVSGNGADTLMNAGKAKKGVVDLQLPEKIPNKYLEVIPSSSVCDVSPKDAKWPDEVKLRLYDGNNHIGDLRIEYIDTDNDYGEAVEYLYSTKAVSINCKNAKFGGDDYNYNENVKAKAGWNKQYILLDEKKKTMNVSTNNILTKEAKWTLHVIEDEDSL